MMSRIKNLIKYPVTILFAASVIMMLILSLIIPDREKSEWENRYLAKMPVLSMTNILDSSFMSGYEDYINDQLPGRDALIKIKALCETLFLKIENNGIVKGSKSQLFTKEIKSSAQFDKNIGIIEKFLADNNLSKEQAKICVIPNAAGILETDIPKGFPGINQSAKFEDFYRENHANVVELKSVLRAHEDEYIYYRTDHHYTTLGAYYVYKEIIDGKCDISSLESHEVKDFYGTLYAKYKGLGVESDTLTYYDIPVKSFITDDEERESLYDFEKIDAFDKYGMFLYGNFGKSVIESLTCDNGKEAVIFKDSYANCLIPFMTFDYEKITLIDLRFFGESVSELLDNNSEADLYFIYNFDFLNEDNHFYKLVK